ncbi:hypothetical protein KF728_23840 [Candidatus Obscuribacterales bacterium]|nr:hypothetical protein [Candidatus Obscuribacterales bacterium]
METEIKHESNDKIDLATSVKQANIKLYEDSCNKFGKQNVDGGEFNKNDLAEMTAVAVLGPGACNTLGHENTKLAGAAMVSLVAPALIGGIIDGKEHFQKHPMDTLHKGCGNILSGAAGAAMFSINPVVASGFAMFGAGLLINDQFNNQRNKERNLELLKVSSNLNNMDNDQLLQASIKLRPYLGPDAYEAAFITATSSLGLKPGQQLGRDIKPRLNLDALSAQTQNITKMLTGSIGHFARARQPKLGTAGVLLSERFDDGFDVPKYHRPERSELPRKPMLGNLNEKIEANPNEAHLYHKRARHHMERGQRNQDREAFEDALKDLNHYLKLKPNDPHALLSRTKVHLELGSKERAVNDFCSAIPNIKIADGQLGVQLTNLEARLRISLDEPTPNKLARALSPDLYPNEPIPANIDLLQKLHGAKLNRFLKCEVDQKAGPNAQHLAQLNIEHRHLEEIKGVEFLRYIALGGKQDLAGQARSRCLVDKLEKVQELIDRNIFAIRTEVEPDKLLSELNQRVKRLNDSLVTHESRSDRTTLKELNLLIEWVEARRPPKWPWRFD